MAHAKHGAGATGGGESGPSGAHVLAPRKGHGSAHTPSKATWAAVYGILIALTIGGVALPLHLYWLVGVCLLICVALFGYALANGIMDDTH